MAAIQAEMVSTHFFPASSVNNHLVGTRRLNNFAHLAKLGTPSKKIIECPPSFASRKMALWYLSSKLDGVEPAAQETSLRLASCFLPALAPKSARSSTETRPSAWGTFCFLL